MPGFDRTGPMGQGPRTGRQMGKCAPREKKNSDNGNEDRNDNPETGTMDPEQLDGLGYGRIRGRGPGFGRGRGTGRGTGRGMGRGIGRNRKRNRGN